MKPVKSILALLLLNVPLTHLAAQYSEFYGMTFGGGEYNCGTIFKTDPFGNNLQLIFNFQTINMGARPVGHLCESNEGKLFGMTHGGGLKDLGTLFEWDPGINSFVKRLDFNGITNGSNPFGSLISADNGEMLGMTGSGGKYDMGVFFKWDPLSDLYTKVFDFNGYENGSYPGGSLIKAKNGKYYGLTASGGVYNKGVIFEWDPVEEKYSKKHDFIGGAFGDSPYGTLIQANNDLLYGVTWDGGVSGDGVLFEWNPNTDTYTKKIDFNNIEYGREPRGSLLQCSNGKIYGTTQSGGVFDMGIFFEWDPVTNGFTKLVDFNGSEKGRYPNGSLLQADSSKIYGLTKFGGTYGQGVFFEWDLIHGTFNKKLDFNDKLTGAIPNYLMQTKSGKIFVTTTSGYINEEGTIIECDPVNDKYIRHMSFIDNRGDNGKNPVGKLVQADNGKLYGLTNQGGTKNDSAAGQYSNGVLFEFDPITLTYSKKFEFDWSDYGSKPIGSLVKANNGKLYGMTPEGGTYYDSYSGYISHGVLFEWNPAIDSFRIMHKFNKSDGGYPQGSLIKATNEKLYGMTSDGGEYGYGVIFEFDCNTNGYSKRFDFDLIENGGDPRGTLMEADNGKLYGMTFSGGTFGYGVLFKWTTDSNKYTKLFDFNDIDGRYPGGSLVQTSNGKLYGLTAGGGEFDGGVLFEFDPLNHAFNKKLDFNYSYGGSPYGSLIHGSNDRLYGFTWDEEVNELGVFFEWDTSNDSLTIKHDFREKTSDGSFSLLHMQKIIHDIVEPSLIGLDPATITGSYFSSSLTEIDYKTYSTIYAESCDKFQSPSNKHTWTTSGVYLDTIPNLKGGDSIITVNLTIKKSSIVSILQEACDYYISPGGQIWTISGVYADTIANSCDCDSIIVVQLTIMPVNTSVTQNQFVLTANTEGATYQWINCGNDYVPIVGAIHQNFTPVEDGNYAVIVSQYGCTDTSACHSVIITGFVMNNFKQNITLYPNPNEGSFSIDLGNVYPNTEISISELDGRIIRKDEVFNSRIIDLQFSATPGMYLVTISSDNERAVFKILKK